MSKWLTIENKANRTAKITISGYIGESWWDEGTSKEAVRAELEAITQIKADTIEVEIDSFGGDVNHGLSIYNALKTHKAQIHVDFIGWSASIATVIAMAGDTRKAPDNWMGLIHEARSWQIGTAEAMDSMATWLKKTNQTIIDIYVRATGKSEADIKNIMALDGGEGQWMTANEMKDLGLLTDVYQPMKAAAAVDPKILAEYKLPEIDKSKIKNIMKDEKSLMDKAKELFNWKNDEALTAENETLKTDITNLNTQIVENKGVLEVVQAELVTANSTIETLKAEKEADVLALNDSVAEKQTQIEALETEIAQLKANAVDPTGTGDPNPGGKIELTEEEKEFERVFKEMAEKAK